MLLISLLIKCRSPREDLKESRLSLSPLLLRLLTPLLCQAGISGSSGEEPLHWGEAKLCFPSDRGSRGFWDDPAGAERYRSYGGPKSSGDPGRVCLYTHLTDAETEVPTLAFHLRLTILVNYCMRRAQCPVHAS